MMEATLERVYFKTMDKIMEGLYLGGILAASEATLAKEGFTHVLSVIDDADKVPCGTNVKRLCIDIEDADDQDLLSYFQRTFEFIDSALKDGDGKVLVHCAFGVSRSSTVTIAYAMKKLKMSADDATALVRRGRPMISPNPGFVRQLTLYQRMNCNLYSDLYKRYVFSRLKSDPSILDRIPFPRDQLMTTARSSLTADIREGGDMTASCKCHKCRNYLFNALHVMHHAPGESTDVLQAALVELQPHQQCPQGIFVEPLGWMAELLGKTEGKLHCPHCKSKLGSFHWAGTKCGCGAWITPSCHIHKGKVDETAVHESTKKYSSELGAKTGAPAEPSSSQPPAAAPSSTVTHL